MKVFFPPDSLKMIYIALESKTECALTVTGNHNIPKFDVKFEFPPPTKKQQTLLLKKRIKILFCRAKIYIIFKSNLTY